MSTPLLGRAAGFACAFLLVRSAALAATIIVPAGSDQSQIQSYINSAVAGDTVQFTAAAVHTLTGPLTLKNGIIVDGNTAKWYGGASPEIIVGVNATALTSVTIKNLVLDNVMLKLWSSTAVSAVSGITIDNCTFQNGKAQTGMTQVNSFYVQVRAASITIQNSKFLRTATYKGRGIQFYLAENCTVQNCLIGTSTYPTTNHTTHGHFKTGINVSNSSAGGSDPVTNSAKNITLTGNRIYRNPAMADTGGDAGDSDHGIYAHGFDGFIMTGNTVSGWAPTAAGGGLKIRNALNARVETNTFLRSGILMYVYTGSPLLYLKYVDILDNTITLNSLNPLDMYQGIGFWRNFATSNQAEYSILVSGNTISRGHIYLFQSVNDPIHVSDWNALGGGCTNNTATKGGTIHLQVGMTNSGNSPTPVLH